MKPKKKADKIAGFILLTIITGTTLYFVPITWYDWLILFGSIFALIIGIYLIILFLSNFSIITHQNFIVGRITNTLPIKMYDLHYENGIFTTKGPVLKKKFNLSNLVEIRLCMDVDLGCEEHYFLHFTFKNKQKLLFNGANHLHIALVNEILTNKLNREPIEYNKPIATPFFKNDEGKEYKIIYSQNK